MPAYKMNLSITIPEDIEVNEVVSDLEDALEELDNINEYSVTNVAPEPEC